MVEMQGRQPCSGGVGHHDGVVYDDFMQKRHD
jgi:hypothetical protein